MIDIINISDFKERPLTINDSSQDELILFDGLLKEVQPTFFISILGAYEYQKMLNDYDEISKTFSTQFYTDFIFGGVDYFIDDLKIPYIGVKRALIYWFYFNWIVRDVPQTGRGGVGITESENETLINPIGLQGALNSELIRLVGAPHPKCNYSDNILGDSNKPYLSQQQKDNLKYTNSIYNYLQNNGTGILTNWNFSGFKSKNSFGI